MEIKVYVDVLFVVNFILDYLLLWLTGLLLAKPANFGRLLFAAFIGAIYATLVFFLPINFLFSLPCKLLMGAGITALGFRPKSLRVFLQYVCVFYLLTFFWGGAAFFFFYFSGAAASFGAVYRNGSLYINIPVYQLLLLALACLPVMKAAVYCSTKIQQKQKGITLICVVYHGKTLHLRALYDSGNFLRDEISGRSVIIAEWDCAKHLFPTCKKPEDAACEGLIPIRYRTLCSDSLLYAFLPEAIYIKNKNRLIPTETVYIGLLDRTLDHYHNWDAILPHDFEGENQHETKLTPKTFNLI